MSVKDEIDSIIEAHFKWKETIELVVATDLSILLNPTPITHDECCKLGKWIYSIESHDEIDRLLHREIRDTHALFHYKMSQWVLCNQTKNSGGFDAAKKEIDALSILLFELLIGLKESLE